MTERSDPRKEGVDTVTYDALLETRMLKRLQNRDEKALHWLIDTYGPLYKAVILRTLHDLPDEVEPCLQDTFLNIWQHIDCWNVRKGSFKTWSCAIARYRAIDALAKERKRYAQDTLTLDEPSSHNNIGWHLELESLLSTLTPQDQALFKDLFYYGYTPAEAATRHGISRANVYNRVSLGRTQLQKALRKGEETK